MARKLSSGKLKTINKLIGEVITNNSDEEELNKLVLSKISNILQDAVNGKYNAEINNNKMIASGQVIPSKGILIPRPNEKTKKQYIVRKKSDSEKADAIKNVARG